MKTILKDHPCYVHLGVVKTEANGETKDMARPKLVVIKGEISYRNYSSNSIRVEALLDTGNEVTIISPKKVRELESDLGFRLPIKRKIQYYGHAQLQPTFDIAFVFPGDYPYFSDYGFITPTDWDFDVADIWLGQDIFGQLVITLNGANETVTISDPNIESTPV